MTRRDLDKQVEEAYRILAEVEPSIKNVRRKARIKAIKLAGTVRDKCEATIMQALEKAGLPREAVMEVLDETLDNLEDTLTEAVTEAFIQVLQKKAEEGAE